MVEIHLPEPDLIQGASDAMPGLEIAMRRPGLIPLRIGEFPRGLERDAVGADQAQELAARASGLEYALDVAGFEAGEGRKGGQLGVEGVRGHAEAEMVFGGEQLEDHAVELREEAFEAGCPAWGFR